MFVRRSVVVLMALGDYGSQPWIGKGESAMAARTSTSTGSRASSARRLRANRQNARRSTGPRTTAGKQRSSQNSTSHGVFCRDLVLPGESREEFDAFRNAYLLRLSPQDVLELLIVDRIVAASWKLRRLQAAEPYLHAAEAERMRESEDALRERAEDELIERERMLGGSPLAASQMLNAEVPTHQRYPAAATLAISLLKGDGGFERLTRIEQRLERSIHRNLDELRKLRKVEDESASLAPSMRPCPFLAEAVAEQEAEDEAVQEGEERAKPATSGVQNEPNAESSSPDKAAGAAGARRDRAEYSPTPLGTAAPLVGNQCHGERGKLARDEGGQSAGGYNRGDGE